MKIGTDAVLLGAWTSLENNPLSILDIGAGTGVLSLMLAQRSSKTRTGIEIMDAIEIDDDAYEQCVDNFEASPWGDVLFCYHASLEEFVEDIEDTYDVIICNPPFYKSSRPTTSPQNGETPMSESRQKARFNDAMPFEDLVESASKLLSEKGVFSVIVPYKEEDVFSALASKHHLFPNRICHVKGNPSSEIKRSLMEFSFSDPDSYRDNTEISELIIETERHQYTEDYINLTQDFYLKM